jgi:hypothetical protein
MALLLLMGSAAQAGTLWVNRASKGGFSSIGAALKLIQSVEPQGPNTINVLNLGGPFTHASSAGCGD